MARIVAMQGDTLFDDEEIIDKVFSEAYGWTKHSETLHNLSGGKRPLVEYKPLQFLDRRKGYMTLFNYCPYSGEKINWRKIKDAVKKREATT